MSALRREKSMKFVIGTQGENFWSIRVARIVPGLSGQPYIKAEVYASDITGNHDPEMKVLEVDGVDTLELQIILMEIKRALAEITGVHVQ